MYKSERMKRIKNQRRLRLALRFYTAVFLITVVTTFILGKYDVKVQSPIVFAEKQTELISPLAEVTPTATPSASPTPTTVKREPRNIIGEASYYSREGCLGCDPNRIMANGQPLDDSALTLAMTPEMVRQYKLLNKFVYVQNLKTGDTVRARVTDTGGFGPDRVADLTIATRDAIKCNNLCKVKIIY